MRLIQRMRPVPLILLTQNLDLPDGQQRERLNLISEHYRTHPRPMRCMEQNTTAQVVEIATAALTLLSAPTDLVVRR